MQRLLSSAHDCVDGYKLLLVMWLKQWSFCKTSKLGIISQVGLEDRYSPRGRPTPAGSMTMTGEDGETKQTGSLSNPSLLIYGEK